MLSSLVSSSLLSLLVVVVVCLLLLLVYIYIYTYAYTYVHTLYIYIYMLFAISIIGVCQKKHLLYMQIYGNIIVHINDRCI